MEMLKRVAMVEVGQSIHVVWVCDWFVLSIDVTQVYNVYSVEMTEHVLDV